MCTIILLVEFVQFENSWPENAIIKGELSKFNPKAFSDDGRKFPFQTWYGLN